MSLFESILAFMAGLVLSAGRASVLFFHALRHFPSLLKARNFKRMMTQAFECGVSSIPVVTVTALFTGMITAGQTGWELKKLGLEWTVGAIVGVGMTREMGPVFTAIVVTGFVGGGMTSVIATMRINEEIDALEVMSINPVRFLITPRLAAMLIVVPVLTVYADVVGILGGAVVCRYQLDIPYESFWNTCSRALQVTGDVGFGLLKSVVFAMIITMIACEQGYSASGGAEGVGHATMRTVVYCFLLILIANYLLLTLLYVPIWG